MRGMEMVEVSDREGALSLDDCRCPVCLEIFMEPVTLPCTHTFCKDCFLETVDKAALCCPLCRKRVSTWARANSRNNTLVNEQLWTQIQTCFPLQCQRRLNGQDAITEDDPGVSVCFPRVSQPGELRQEYEDQLTKLTEEKRVLEEEERKASEEYIQRLLAEEEELLQEERRRQEDDERLAKLLNNQLNSAAVSQENLRPAAVSQENLRPAAVTPAKKKKEVSAGQIDRFLCPRPSMSSDCSFMSNKENILVSPVMLQAEHSPPTLDYYGTQTNGDRSRPPTLHPAPPSASVEEQLHPERHEGHLTGDGGPSSVKRKSSKDEEEVTKRVCHSLPSTSSSSSPVEVGGSVLQGITEWEAELLSRRQQEEEDWRLALLLQKKMDQEEKQRATDRRKGSSDAYLLRQNRRGKAGSSIPPRETTKTSSPSPASTVKPSKSSSSFSSSSSRGSKQTTLTDLFSNQSG